MNKLTHTHTLTHTHARTHTLTQLKMMHEHLKNYMLSTASCSWRDPQQTLQGGGKKYQKRSNVYYISPFFRRRKIKILAAPPAPPRIHTRNVTYPSVPVDVGVDHVPALPEVILFVCVCVCVCLCV